MRNLEIISLIYKSTDYLKSIIAEMQSSNADGWNITCRVVANDASECVLGYLEGCHVNYTIYKDPNPSDYYLNRVYRCWNFAAKTSEATNICFVNSDMIFSEGWLSNLLSYHDGVNIPTSRLIESGKMESGTHGVSVNCGQTLRGFDRASFASVCETIKEDGSKPGGLFMPCIFEKDRFVGAGMFPEGNIYLDGVGTRGVFVESGDRWFFDYLEKHFSMKHITVFNSLVYHFQEGEKDE